MDFPDIQFKLAKLTELCSLRDSVERNRDFAPPGDYLARLNATIASLQAAVCAPQDELAQQMLEKVRSTLSAYAIRSVPAKVDKLTNAFNKLYDLVPDDEKVPPMSAANPVRREMIDWVVNQVPPSAPHGAAAECIREIWEGYLANRDKLPIKCEMELPSFTSSVSTARKNKNYHYVQKPYKYIPILLPPASLK